MNIELLVKQISDFVVGWPLMIFVIVTSLIYTIALYGIQFRYFFSAWKATLFPSKKSEVTTGEMSPFQAFINTINSNLGNGSIAGMGTAIYAGGPGAALWVIIFGFILMAIRFAEVYISALYGMKKKTNSSLGGPMLYLQDVIGGRYLPFLYAFFCILFGLLGGNAMQANSIQVSLSTTWGIPIYVSGIILFAFVLYTLFGGAQRIIKISLAIVPIKVAVFVISSFAVLMYHYKSLPAALHLIFTNGLGISAFAGGVVGFSLQQIIRAGMTRSIFATESGLGSAAILFGSTGSNDPIQSGLMGMVSTFLSTLVCFIVALCIVVAGVWDSGLNSTALTIEAFNTVFGRFGGWIVSFLSISFGFGVLVAYAYIARVVWFFLTNNKYPLGFIIIYSACTLWGALSSVNIVWDLINIAVAGTLLINLYGLLLLLPKIRPELMNQLRSYKA